MNVKEWTMIQKDNIVDIIIEANIENCSESYLEKIKLFKNTLQSDVLEDLIKECKGKNTKKLLETFKTKYKDSLRY